MALHVALTESAAPKTAARPGRNYFSEYAAATPMDSFIMTLGCGKYRLHQHEYGDHLGLPRLLDMGQCNDAYGAIQVALALAKNSIVASTSCRSRW